MNELDKKKIKSLLQNTDGWEALLRYINELKSEWDDESCNFETEWESAKLILKKEYKKEGLTEFINKLERIAYN